MLAKLDTHTSKPKCNQTRDRQVTLVTVTITLEVDFSRIKHRITQHRFRIELARKTS